MNAVELEKAVASLVRLAGHAAVQRVLDEHALPAPAERKDGRRIPLDADLPLLKRAAELWREEGQPAVFWPYLQAVANDSGVRRLYRRLQEMSFVETMDLPTGALLEFACAVQKMPPVSQSTGGGATSAAVAKALEDHASLCFSLLNISPFYERLPEEIEMINDILGCRSNSRRNYN